MENFCLIKENGLKENIKIIKNTTNYNKKTKKVKIKYIKTEFKNKEILVINKSAKEKIFFKFDKIFKISEKKKLYKKIFSEKIKNLIEGKNSIFLFFSNLEKKTQNFEKSVFSNYFENLLKDLIFLTKNLDDKVKLLISVTINDNTKFIDIFQDFSRGLKKTEILITKNNFEEICERIFKNQKKFLGNLKNPVICYKIKFCYFHKISSLDLIQFFPNFENLENFDFLMKKMFLLVTGQKRLFESFSNSFSILNELLEKNYDIYSMVFLDFKKKIFEKNFEILFYNEKLKTFIEYFFKMKENPLILKNLKEKKKKNFQKVKKLRKMKILRILFLKKKILIGLFLLKIKKLKNLVKIEKKKILKILIILFIIKKKNLLIREFILKIKKK